MISANPGLRLKKAAFACSFALYPYVGRSKKGLMIFGVAAMVVPPPLGLVSGVVAAVAFNMSAAAGQKLLQTVQRCRGLASPRDFEILGEFNRMRATAPRLALPNAKPALAALYAQGQTQAHTPSHSLSHTQGQKTVFPVAEMR